MKVHDSTLRLLFEVMAVVGLLLFLQVNANTTVLFLNLFAYLLLFIRTDFFRHKLLSFVVLSDIKTWHVD